MQRVAYIDAARWNYRSNKQSKYLKTGYYNTASLDTYPFTLSR